MMPGPTRPNISKSRKTAKPARKPSCCWRRDLRHRLNDRQALPPPPRPEAKSEANRRPVSVIRSRVIRIRPIIGWPRQIIRPVVSAVPVTIVVPIAAPRAQVCRLRGVTCVHAGLRRSRGGRLNRRHSGQRQASGNDRCSDQCLHGELLIIPQGAD